MQVILTGANRGIGAEIQTQMTARGDTVIGTSRDGSTGHMLDVTNPESLHAFAALQSGPADLLICNAGVYLDKGHDLDTGFDAAAWADSFAVNVAGVFQTIQTLLPQLAQSSAPKIAIIASRMGYLPESKGGAYIYRASKSAAINLAGNLAADLKPRGIAVAAYHPGFVQTDMGGAAADIDAATSAAGLIARFDDLSVTTTGTFQNYDGTLWPID
jgi:NAD(P)-dependent dehydrogenase (short-subunit alcohol dehydrogenase family)